jgi:hypothetical protein
MIKIGNLKGVWRNQQGSWRIESESWRNPVLKPLKTKILLLNLKKPFLFFDNLAGISPFLVEFLQKRKRSDELIDNERTNPATKTIFNSNSKDATCNWT